MCDATSWIQAVSAVVLVVATIATFIVLLSYAADTKKIATASIEQAKASAEQAKNSAQQLEDSQTPFLALVEFQPPETGYGPWRIKNQGSGVAVNIFFTIATTLDRSRRMGWASPLAPGETKSVSNETSDIASTTDEGFVVEYESLSGKQYRTTVKRRDNQLNTKFERL
jgi:hypothetical protein